MEFTINAWSSSFNKAELVDLLRAHNVPVAPVRTLPEVVEDSHMHGRGTLQRVQHPEFGDVILPHSALRFEGEQRVPVQPSPRLGEHTYQVLSDWLAYDKAGVDVLLEQGVLEAAVEKDFDQGP